MIRPEIVDLLIPASRPDIFAYKLDSIESIRKQ